MTPANSPTGSAWSSLGRQHVGTRDFPAENASTFPPASQRPPWPAPGCPPQVEFASPPPPLPPHGGLRPTAQGRKRPGVVWPPRFFPPSENLRWSKARPFRPRPLPPPPLAFRPFWGPPPPSPRVLVYRATDTTLSPLSAAPAPGSGRGRDRFGGARRVRAARGSGLRRRGFTGRSWPRASTRARRPSFSPSVPPLGVGAKPLGCCPPLGDEITLCPAPARHEKMPPAAPKSPRGAGGPVPPMPALFPGSGPPSPVPQSRWARPPFPEQQLGVGGNPPRRRACPPGRPPRVPAHGNGSPALAETPFGPPLAPNPTPRAPQTTRFPVSTRPPPFPGAPGGGPPELWA